MRLTIRTHGQDPRCIYVRADGSALVEGACPHCHSDELLIAGTGRRASRDGNAHEADGYALCCGSYVGTIRADVDTIFGVREDEDVRELVASRGGRVYC